MKKITKKQSAEFNKKVIALIIFHGFVKNNLGEIRFEKNTDFGRVEIALWVQTGSEIYSIFSRFDDVQKALTVFNCNQFSGKYNFHCANAQECFGMFEFFLHELNTCGHLVTEILGRKTVA